MPHFGESENEQVGNVVRGIENGLRERKRLGFEHFFPFLAAVDVEIAVRRFVHDDAAVLLHPAQQRAERAAVIERLRGVEAGVGVEVLAERENILAHGVAEAAEELRFAVVRTLHRRAARGPVRGREKLLAERAYLADVPPGAEHDLHAAFLCAADRLRVAGRDAAAFVQQRAVQVERQYFIRIMGKCHPNTPFCSCSGEKPCRRSGGRRAMPGRGNSAS